MLSRVLTRSLRAHPTIIPAASAPLYLQSRHYAKHNPQRPQGFKPPNQPVTGRNGPHSSQTNQTAPEGSPSESRSPASTNLLKNQKIEKRIPPRSPPPPENSKIQDEFQTSAPSDSNTAPPFTSSSATDPSYDQGAEQPAHPSQPLPDLTQGIPSTLDAELAQRSEKSDPASLNITEDPNAGGQKGELPKSAYISSLERRKTRFARILYAVMLANVTGAAIWYGRNWPSEEEERRHPHAPSGWGFGLFYNRVKARMTETMAYYKEPTFPKLLPDPDPAWARPYTLVLSLEDLLVHGEWSREHGWRMAKRPGVDYFLRYLSSYYELVIWTDSPSMIAHPIITKLDPYRVVMWPLFREATRYQDGKYIKDLECLNRDPKKTLIIDTDPSHTKLQPDNAIILPPWQGKVASKDLVSLIPFLEYCATMDFGDLRDVLKSFNGKNIPQEYARREAIWREKQQKAMAEQIKKRPKRSLGLLSALAGPSPNQLVGPDGKPLPSLSEAMAEGKTYQDVVRERGQKQYEMLEKEIKENGEKWLKEMADDEKRMNEEAMQGMKKSVFGWFLPNQDRSKHDGKGSGGGAESVKRS